MPRCSVIEKRVVRVCPGESRLTVTFLCVNLHQPIDGVQGANAPSAREEIERSIFAGPASPLHFIGPMLEMPNSLGLRLGAKPGSDRLCPEICSEDGEPVSTTRVRFSTAESAVVIVERKVNCIKRKRTDNPLSYSVEIEVVEPEQCRTKKREGGDTGNEGIGFVRIRITKSGPAVRGDEKNTKRLGEAVAPAYELRAIGGSSRSNTRGLSSRGRSPGPAARQQHSDMVSMAYAELVNLLASADTSDWCPKGCRFVWSHTTKDNSKDAPLKDKPTGTASNGSTPVHGGRRSVWVEVEYRYECIRVVGEDRQLVPPAVGELFPRPKVGALPGGAGRSGARGFPSVGPDLETRRMPPTVGPRRQQRASIGSEVPARHPAAERELSTHWVHQSRFGPTAFVEEHLIRAALS